MSNYKSEVVDTGVVALANVRTGDGIIQFTGAGKLSAGTILARTGITGRLAPFVGTTDVPVAVLDGDVEAKAAGDVPCRIILAADIRKQRLIIAADGNDSNVTAAILDQLRAVGIVALDVHELGA